MGIFAGLLGMVSAASFYVTMRLVVSGREVTVPDLSGLTIEEARAAASRAELYLQEEEGRYDGAVPEGRVRAQEPPAGATIKKSRKVKVSVSLGPMDITVPDVRGRSARAAGLALEREGLRVGHVSRSFEGEVPDEVVMAQDPFPSGPADEPRTPSARTDGAVDLLVSRGARPVRFIMPDLTGRSSAEVAGFARRARLRMGPVRREQGGGRGRGVVLRQYPAAGQPVGRNDIISLVLSE